MAGLIVHEWISRIGGSEKVLDAMVGTFPDAEVLCLWNDAPDLRYPGRAVRETWLARTPLRRSKAAALPLMPPTWRAQTAARPDWILASSHLFAHHVRLRNAPDVPKYAYVYTPARYIWTPELDARGSAWLPRLASPSLRRLDRQRAREPVKVAAISEYVRERIQATWHRDAEVIYPPVDVERIQSVEDWSEMLGEREHATLASLPGTFVLGASRFIAYKRLDLVIEAGVAVGLPVVLAGSGPEEPRLRAQAATANVPVRFIQDPSDALLFALYQAALVFVFPAVEDFGIMPVEALAAGTPVVVAPAGGAREIVIDEVSGSVAAALDRESFGESIHRCRAIDPLACRSRAEVFSRSRFALELKDWLRVRTDVKAGGARA